MSISKSSAFNLKVVLKETGIAADTLRAWERRYGLPMPERTPGGHRLYSQHDIETIKWLMARQTEGLSISRAVDMWNEQTSSGSDPLAGLHQPAPAPAPSMSLENTRLAWITACFNYDTVATEQILNQAFAIHSVEVICTDVLLRSLYEIGELWHKGTASVQQEHFTSAIATRRLEALINATPPPSRTETIITACPPEEWHTFPLLLMTLFLRRRGWNVVYLGANVPTDRMEETIQTIHPELVILSAQTLITAVPLREMARVLNKKGIKTAFGGRVFNRLTDLPGRIPAYFLGNTIEYSVPAIEKLITNQQPLPSEEPIKKSTLQTTVAFRQMRSQIESALAEVDASNSHPLEFIETANRFLGDSLIAALELGDTAYLSTDINWISNLLIGHKVSVVMLPIYLEMYARLIDEVMGESGKEISDWLKFESAKLKT